MSGGGLRSLTVESRNDIVLYLNIIMAKPPELSLPDSGRHLVSLDTDYTLDESRVTVEPYDGSPDEALTAALEVSWIPDCAPPVSTFMVRRQLQIEGGLLDAARADPQAQSSAPTAEIESFQRALNPQAHGLGRAGLYLIVDNTHTISTDVP